jgi:hypothetical protein
LSKSRSKIYPQPDEQEDSDKCRTIDFIKSQLNTGYCEEYKFGKRNVFGKFQTDNKRNGDDFFSWPSMHLHKKARDAHPELNERYPVPDQKVSWTNELDETEYRPNLASNQVHPHEANTNEHKNPCGRHVFFFVRTLLTNQ